MAIRLSTAAQAAYDAAFVAAKDTALDDAFDLADGGSGAAVIKVYTGSKPSTADSTATGTLLATFTCADPAFAGSTAASKALDAAPDLTATTVASGAPGYARMEDSAGGVVFDGTVAVTSADFITSSSPWSTSQIVNLTTGGISIT